MTVHDDTGGLLNWWKDNIFSEIRLFVYFFLFRRYDTITPTGLPCHREPLIVLMSMTRNKRNQTFFLVTEHPTKILHYNHIIGVRTELQILNLQHFVRAPPFYRMRRFLISDTIDILCSVYSNFAVKNSI